VTMMERIEKMKVSDDALDLVFHVSDLKISNLTKNNIWSPYHGTKILSVLLAFPREHSNQELVRTMVQRSCKP
jgi:hypothetical protein